jgi:hypothetical protein
MSKIAGNVLSVLAALLIGFYAGAQWSEKKTDSISSPQEPAVTEHAPALPREQPVQPVDAPRVADVVSPQFKDKKTAVSVAAPPPMKCPELPAEHISQQIAGFDSKKMDAVYQQIHSEDAQKRHESLRTLAQFGTEEIMPDLIRTAADDEESSDLRRDLIQQIDWAGHTKELGDILSRSRDAEARLAAVNTIASAKHLTDAELEGLGSVMINNFLVEPEEGIKIATLNCIQAVYPDSFQEVLEKYPHVLATPEVQAYLKRLTAPPDENAQAPAEERKEEMGG